MNLTAIYEYVERIASTSSRKEKEVILQELKESEHSETAKRVLFDCYDPSINYYVEDLTYLPTEPSSVVLEYDELLDALSERILTGDAAKDAIAAFINNATEQEAEMIKRIIKRDIRAGISAKTINKVFPKLIRETPYMRCSSLTQKTLSNLVFPAFSQVKADGVFINIIVDGKVEYVSRSGNTINLNSVVRDSSLIKSANGNVVMGEALVKDGNGGYLNRQEGNGYINSDDVDPELIEFVVWDIVSKQEFYAGQSTTKYADRLDALKVICQDLVGVSVIETQIVNSLDEIIGHFKQCRALGLEGTVVKNLAGLFKDGTSKDQLKVKVVAECDLVIVGYTEGEGKYAGKVGSVTLQSADSVVEVGVSGFSDEMREMLTENIDSYIDAEYIMAIKFNDLLNKEGSDTLSLFLPRFLELRQPTDKFGKESADSVERIKEILDNFTLTVK